MTKVFCLCSLLSHDFAWFRPSDLQINLSKNEPMWMCKESCCVGLGQEGCCLCEGAGNCLKYLKRGWSRIGGMVNKNLKRKGSRHRCLKRGVSWLEPSYKLCFGLFYLEPLFIISSWFKLRLPFIRLTLGKYLFKPLLWGRI